MATGFVASTPAAVRRLSRGAAVMAVAGIGFVGYGLLFLVQNFTGFLELGISQAEVDVGRAEIQQFSPSLYHYVSHLHVALSGFIAACGVAVAALAWFGVRRGQRWAWVTAVTTGAGAGGRLARAPIGPVTLPSRRSRPGVMRLRLGPGNAAGP